VTKGDELREKVREILSRDRSSGSVRHYFARLEEDTNDTLSLIAEEVRKAKNPKWKGNSHCQLANVTCIPKEHAYYDGCEAFRQAILKLLEEK